MEKCQARGVYLTWEDLRVQVSNGKGTTTSILHGVTGYARPGEVLAVMGPSGCGKSTLLNALAGRLHSNAKTSGKILVNGHKQDLAYGTSAYVTQDDTLIATLTVREAVYYSSELQLPESVPRSEKRKRGDKCIQEMGLQDAIHTRIGGLSGGQKRRLSICIETLTNPMLLLLDEPTSGLDSAASFYVMKGIAGIDKRDGRTIIVVIHQPSSEVFQLFDNLCLLSSGSTLFFGPIEEALQFFAINGFPCPTFQNPSDHFLHTINKDFDEDIEQGTQGKKRPIEEVIQILINSYKSSQNYSRVQTLVSEITNQQHETLEKEREGASFKRQCVVLTRRSCVNMCRDLGYYWLRLAVYVTLAFGLGTIFFNLGFSYNSIQARGSLLMFVASFLTFMAIGGFPSFVEDMKVFKRERLNGHYDTSAFIFGNTISSIPYLLLISFIPGVITYYLVGLHKGYQHFIYYALVLFASMLLIESLMMIVASLVPNFLMGIITGAGIQGLMILGGGFFRLPDDMPTLFWRYPVYYISLHRYAYEGLFKNEFQGLNFNGIHAKANTINGEEILRHVWQMDVGYSKWVDLGILIGMVVIYRILFLVIIKSNERVIPAVRAFMMKRSKEVIQEVSETSQA